MNKQEWVKKQIENIWLCNEFAELYLKSTGHFEIINEYSPFCPICGEKLNDCSDVGFCDNCNEATGEPQEIYQWFLVDNWTAEKLIEIGEPVLETEQHFLWGRTCCGQSINLDGTFQEIYDLINKEI